MGTTAPPPLTPSSNLRKRELKDIHLRLRRRQDVQESQEERIESKPRKDRPYASHGRESQEERIEREEVERAKAEEAKPGISGREN